MSKQDDATWKLSSRCLCALGFGGKEGMFICMKILKECLTTHTDAIESSTGLDPSNSESIVTTEGNVEYAPMQTHDFSR